MMGFGYGGWWMWLGGLLVIAVTALVIYALVVIVGRSGRNPARFSYDEQRNNAENALEILAGRFARGEINDEEYRQKREALKNP